MIPGDVPTVRLNAVQRALGRCLEVGRVGRHSLGELALNRYGATRFRKQDDIRIWQIANQLGWILFFELNLTDDAVKFHGAARGGGLCVAQQSNAFTASAADECNALVLAGRVFVSTSSDPQPLPKAWAVEAERGCPLEHTQFQVRLIL